MRLNLGVLVLINFGIVNSQEKISQDGSALWFTNMELSAELKAECPESICIQESSPTFKIIEQELISTLGELYSQNVTVHSKAKKGSLVVGTANNTMVNNLIQPDIFKKLGDDGYVIQYKEDEDLIVISGNTDKSVLYGIFHYLRWLQTGKGNKGDINITEVPLYDVRMLNHWDNLNGTVERGYAGRSIWKWDELPNIVSPKYKAYARANASIGINATVLNNVNASPDILTLKYIKKIKVIADELRPYGIRVFIAINFSSPTAIGQLSTSDPLNTDVQQWWFNKVNEIYNLIPDFGGFLVKANSEGLPGPQDFGRSHADGANMLADALKPHRGLVMWRAFVYNPTGEDRAKQAYNEFMPLDGQFRSNVIVQVKNGPVDFQPREPCSPLFGAMQHTTLMPELQITQEYLGYSDHLVYLGTLFKEFLDTDTYTKGKGTTVAHVTDGTIFNDSVTAIAGVANIGEDINWCGHHFAQANWYVFGRLAWDNQLSAKDIADEWLKQTFSQSEGFVSPMCDLMMKSREATVNYMTPLGLHHLMGWDHHYGPEPWCVVPGARPDWLPTYYHKADNFGIGFNRSSSGSNAVGQYAQPLQAIYDNPAICPKEYLLWFHHLPWDYNMGNGNNLWEELCIKYDSGVQQVKVLQKEWASLKGFVDELRFEEVRKKLVIQTREAIWWRDACLLYFQTFSKRPFPTQLDQPIHLLEELKKQKFDLKHHN